ncbi:acyclic terpene utilization AtuA family protein [Marinovum sp.]|uniref:acyclic terpene utilization AtuA family protein n=1 Tax=Marinovum sp. TaxID=2024839 RepID=UPI002B26807A|nr:acyclic terpene utilization AtuA family protein [Marinovum sp.]
MTTSFLIGNGSGFSGDRIDAPIPVVKTLVADGRPSAIFFEVLGERTVALAQLERTASNDSGYEPMLEPLLEPILKDCFENGIKIIGNFGGANPMGAARCISRLARKLKLTGLRIGVVTGDDIRERISLDDLEVYEADEGIDVHDGTLVSANAYLDAQPLVEALAKGADVVVCGRTGDPSLALAPLIHHFGWSADDWDLLAAGATAGHLLECGSQVCGGVFFEPGYKEIPCPENIGFPIAEIGADGAVIIGKAADTGGLVDARTIKEQLLYEIHDPAQYITPDVTVDLSGVTLQQLSEDRVQILGVSGTARPEKLKVTACFGGSYLGEGEVSVAGPNALARARATRQVLHDRLKFRGLDVTARCDLIGISSAHDSDAGVLSLEDYGPGPSDIRIRLAAAGSNRSHVEQSAREVLALLCCGTAGTGGARWRVTRRVVTRSYLAERAAIQTQSQCFASEDLL